MDLPLKRLDTSAANFDQDLAQLLTWESTSEAGILQTVAQILADVKSRGDAALLEFTQKFDRYSVSQASGLELSSDRLRAAIDKIDPKELNALEQAAQRIRAYAKHQIIEPFEYTESDGTILGQQVNALDRVGLYVPGGKACYPSSVLMNAIPALVAGVRELIMVVPTPDGVLNELVLAAAHVAGVHRVFTVGGAQAIAALAYGTETIPAVDKIVGPGNIYVATAKRMVFGIVGIDMVAGPSEILVICDGKTDPDWIAMDLFSQAEHDEDAQAILISADAEFLNQVQDSVNKLIGQMSRKDIIAQSISARGAMIKVADLDEAVKIANYIAPEHLELSLENPREIARKIHNAGAIFLGPYTAEAIGDYCAGPNHVLPTARSARFSSPLGVYDFQKRSSIIGCSAQGASRLAELAATLAHGEGLTAHARSAEYRIKKP